MKAQAEGLSSADTARAGGIHCLSLRRKWRLLQPSAFCDAGSRGAGILEDVMRQWIRWGVDFENTRFQSFRGGGNTGQAMFRSSN